MGQICSLYGKHVGPCQTPWERVALHHGHRVTSWGSRTCAQKKGNFLDPVV